MRLHLVGFPHTALDDRFSTCAYTQKIVKFRRMGWDDLTVYGGEGADVELVGPVERCATFGFNDPKVPPSWPTEGQWRPFCERAAEAVAERAEPGDLLLLAGGWSQRHVAEANPSLTACEPGVGYEGVWTDFAAFESRAWMHYVYGRRGWDGRWFDRVIPNYFDPDEFPHLNDRGGEHLLYVGRVVGRKGVQAAAEIAEACGRQLHVAGPGPTEWSDGRIVAPEMTIEGDVRYLGVLSPPERAEAMASAYALLTPTVYVEPFGGVAVEAMMCGTPVIATDWGAFGETVTDGVTGHRFRTLRQAVAAAAACAALEPDTIRRHALDRYSLAAVKPLYEQWFDDLGTLARDGWYERAA